MFICFLVRAFRCVKGLAHDTAFARVYVATKFDHELMSTDLTVVKDQRR